MGDRGRIAPCQHVIDAQVLSRNVGKIGVAAQEFALRVFECQFGRIDGLDKSP